MGKNDKERGDGGFSLPLPSSSDLRGRQSVRATFKLSEKAVHALSIVSVQLGIKQKSLFDHLLEDAESLNLIAREISPEMLYAQNRIQKTYVISRKTLNCLDSASKVFGAPRDALVEHSIQRLLPVIVKEREKHQKRKQLLKEISDYFNQGRKILEKSREVLGDDDPVHEKFGSAMTVFYNAHQAIESFVERGNAIEQFLREFGER